MFDITTWADRARTAFLVLCALAFPSLCRAADKDPAATGIHWRGLLLQSFEFLGIEHGFRYATEEGTRHPHRPFFQGYVDSLNGLHGWADGDPFVVNYVGHPMQGAVSGFLFVQNDGGYRGVAFGRNRDYWKSRLRAAAWMWAYSTQFEIGPLSESSIGNVQASYPQQGFADQVVTPAIGFVWMIGEDAIDRTVIRSVENHTTNRFVRSVVRSGLNPSRSLANVVAGKLPWYREARSPAVPRVAPAGGYPVVPSLEFLATARVEQIPGNGGQGICVGGGGTAAFRVSPDWQLVGDVNGCKLHQPAAWCQRRFAEVDARPAPHLAPREAMASLRAGTGGRSKHDTGRCRSPR